MSGIRELMLHYQQEQKPALIAFIMALVPNEDLCLDCIKALEQGGCDILELGVPFTDPLADGEMIERFHHRGIKQGLNLKRGLEFVHQVKNSCEMPLILFSYYNPLYRMGLDKFMQEARAAGVEGLIVPDVPLDEMYVLDGYNIETIPMLAPSSTEARVQMAAERQATFIYCVSVRGVTGMRRLPEQEIKDYLQRIRAATKTPLALGFGISGGQQVETFRDYADGVVIGSYLARIIEEYEARPRLLPGQMEKAFIELVKAREGKNGSV
ncbi:MAG TPA: tryptophan synthase subunit alpha [Gelria sp.]|jgi:tryptophan synthase alpha chain|nr:tryptophan synthase subunit alpha [Gelria sp.]